MTSPRCPICVALETGELPRAIGLSQFCELHRNPPVNDTLVHERRRASDPAGESVRRPATTPPATRTKPLRWTRVRSLDEPTKADVDCRS